MRYTRHKSNTASKNVTPNHQLEKSESIDKEPNREDLKMDKGVSISKKLKFTQDEEDESSQYQIVDA